MGARQRYAGAPQATGRRGPAAGDVDLRLLEDCKVRRLVDANGQTTGGDDRAGVLLQDEWLDEIARCRPRS